MRVLLVPAVLLFLAVAAQADPVVRLTSGSETKSVTDNGIGDLSSDAGVISVAGSVGGFFFNMTLAFTKPFLGSSTEGTMHLTQVSLSGGGGAITIEFTDTDFIAAGPNLSFDAAIGGLTMGTVSYDLKVDPGNSEFGGSVVTSLGPSGPGAFSDAASTFVSGLTTFSMTMVVTIDHPSWGITSFDADAKDPIAPIPEPAGLALLCGACGIVLLRRRRA